MNTQLIKTNRKANTGILFILTAFVILFVLLTILQDRLEADFHSSSFYLSESFIFSSFWWIFIPFLYGQYALAQKQLSNKIAFKILLIITPALSHLLAYPALVWSISRLFYYHTFRFQQTFRYSLSEHLYILLFFYSVPCLLYLHFTAKGRSRQKKVEGETNQVSSYYKTSLIVSEGTRRISIAVNDIIYFTANPPYINIHHRNKKYLHNETLKSISNKINGEEFVRIHKSAIVNVKQVQSYTSRMNGDYDLIMQDGSRLRISRNYAPAFKAALQQSHRVAVK